MLGQHTENGTTQFYCLFQRSPPYFSALICIPHNSRSFGFFVTFTSDLVEASLPWSVIVSLKDFIKVWASTWRKSMTCTSVPLHKSFNLLFDFFVHVFVIQVEQRFLGMAASMVSGTALALEWMWFRIEINMAQSWYRLRSRIPKQWNSIQSVPGTNLYNERPIKLLAFTIYPSISWFMSRCLTVTGCVLHEVLSQNMFSSSCLRSG